MVGNEWVFILIVSQQKFLRMKLNSQKLWMKNSPQCTKKTCNLLGSLIRPPIVDFLFPVTRPHCNFSAACIFIIAFGDHVIKFFVVVAMLLSVCVVVSLGQQLVLWCIIETQDSDISKFSDVVFTVIKPGKFELLPITNSKSRHTSSSRW